jgi:CubicO group peptidase (beta-lactamase class C family)
MPVGQFLFHPAAENPPDAIDESTSFRSKSLPLCDIGLICIFVMKDSSFTMKKGFGKAKWIALILIPLLALGLYTQYPKLTIISGYAAKNLASSVFLAGRTPQAVVADDHDVPMISLAGEVVLPNTKEVEASVFGMHKRRAVFREGLGSVLLPKGSPLPDMKFVPQRNLTPSPLPYPLGHAEPKDTLFPEVDYDQLIKGVEQAFSNPEEQRTRTVAVLYRGHLVMERYVEGFTPDTPVLGWSMTKSILATLYGILEYQGRLDLADPAPVDSWQEDQRREITYNDLLRMQSGLAWDEDYSNISDVTRMLFLAEDMAAIQAEKKMLGPPGSIWNYSSGTSNLLSGILRRHFANQQEYLDFPYGELIDRIGMHSMVLETDYAGNFVGSSYGWASTRDWARFGLLYLNRGNWAGAQLFLPEWTDYVTRPTEMSKGSYGAHFWLNRDGKYPDAPADMFMANGYQGQHVFIIPSMELVIVRTGLAEGPEFKGNAFLKEVLKAFPQKK